MPSAECYADAQAAMKRGMDTSLRRDRNGVIAAVKDAVAADPKFTRGWISLSQFYLSTGKKDEGLEALRKAVQSDPQLPVARKLLAYALMQNQKNPEAIQNWQILQKETPEDQDVTSNLGILFIREKRYNDAISLFTKSLEEDPDNVAQLSELASAYLQSGDKDRGVATFEKVLKSKSDIDTENDVAYQLADANVALPTALEYSQKSVQEEEQDSQKTQLDQLKIDDAAHPIKLGAYWDTLGWIYFRMGDFAKAESYIRAAFELSPSAVVADHLGQVYEQEHKTELAVKMYRAALLQNDNMPDTAKRLEHLTHEKAPQTVNGSVLKPDPYHLQDYLNDLRTVHLPKVVSGEETAEFFVLIAPGGKIKGVHFVSGSEKLKPAEKTLTSMTFKTLFPSGSNALILRRGILGCFLYSGCSFVMIEPERVRSVN
jgi:tetratricopeptide (TPR) repeat protein